MDFKFFNHYDLVFVLKGKEYYDKFYIWSIYIKSIGWKGFDVTDKISKYMLEIEWGILV